MIVWNVAERWFAMKAEAEAYRRGAGYKPDATRRAEIVTREQLTSLLNHGTVSLPAAIPKPSKVDPRQIDMFTQPAETVAGLAAISAVAELQGKVDEDMKRVGEVPATLPLHPDELQSGISTGEERIEPDEVDEAFDGKPIERTTTRVGLYGDGSRYDLDTGELVETY